MPAITATDMTDAGAVDVFITTLDGSTDSLVYNPGKAPVLVLNNVTAGSLSPVIDGAGATAHVCKGVGEIDLTGGYEVGAIAAGESVAIRLKSIEAYLKGAIDIASGTGIEAQLLEF